MGARREHPSVRDSEPPPQRSAREHFHLRSDGHARASSSPVAVADRRRVDPNSGCRCSCRRRRRPARRVMFDLRLGRSASSRRLRSNWRRATRRACDRFRRPWKRRSDQCSVRCLSAAACVDFASAASIWTVCAATRASRSLSRPSRNFWICASSVSSSASWSVPISRSQRARLGVERLILASQIVEVRVIGERVDDPQTRRSRRTDPVDGRAWHLYRRSPRSAIGSFRLAR